MAKLRLSLACWNYDRTRALLEGRIPIEGIELNYLNLPVEETFFRMLRNQEFDVAEMSLSSYTVSLFRENPPFIAIPVFPSRYFRHSCIYVNPDSGIREPKDLIGKRVGNPEYQMTAAGLDPRHLERRIRRPRHQRPRISPAAKRSRAARRRLALSLPPEIRIEAIAPDTNAFPGCSRPARSTRSTPRACRPPYRSGPGKSRVCSRTTTPSSARII